MSKIEIDSLEDLIRKQYPLNYVQKIIDDIMKLSMLVKDDYPNYRDWFLNKQVPGIYDGSRNIIIAHIDDRIVGFVNLKKDLAERKICTFYVAKTFRKNKIGSILALKAIEWLEDDKPLITIPINKIGDFIRIAKRYNWAVTDIKDGLYRTNTPEVIVNSLITQNNIEIIENKPKAKSLSHIWFFYHFNNISKIFSLRKMLLKRS